MYNLKYIYFVHFYNIFFNFKIVTPAYYKKIKNLKIFNLKIE